MGDFGKRKEQLISELLKLRAENDSLKVQIARADKSDSVIKELKKAEEALRESEERYRIISTLTTDYIFRLKVDKDGGIRTEMISDRFIQTTKRSIKDIITPDLWFKIIHPDDLGKVMESLQLLIKNGGSAEVECRSLLSDGTIRSVLVVAQAINIPPQKKTTAIVGAVKDISSRKSAEEALATEQKLLRTLVDLIPALVYIKDCESRFLVANVPCALFMGASSPQDLIGKTDNDFYNPESAAGFRADEIEVLRGNQLINKIEFNTSADGTQHILSTTKVPFYGADEKIKGIVGASHDITEMMRTEKALILSESNLQALINNKNEAIWSLDNNYNLIVCNEFFRISYLAAYNVELKLGINLINLLSPELKTFWKPKYDVALSGEKIFFEFKETIQNQVYYFNVYLNPIISEGRVSGVSALSVDITDRKKVEEALIKAKEKAEESDRLKTAFLANMGHEIRTPMNGIMGFSDLLKNPKLTGEEQQKYVHIIEKSGARMLNIINDLIDISRIESGLINIDFSKYNLNDQLEYIQSFFLPEAEAKGLKFTFKPFLDSVDAFVETDKEKVNAILINLIKNALKFTDNGSIEFGYILKPALKFNESAFIEFFVKDTGVGISPEQREFIFERFRQGSDALNRNYEGAGLGLSISKSYVEMLGGKIWVQSNSEQSSSDTGTVFCFTLPYCPIPSKKAGTEILLPAKTEMNLNKTLNVLIAEDDLAAEILFSKMISLFSKEIYKVRTGIEAVEACRINPKIDLILMDIKMPLLDGLEATRQIRQFNKDVVIIGQTAYAQSNDKKKALEAGCDDYIAKPIDKEKLILMIIKHFSLKTSGKNDK
jgi:PAS domain S-box-containing protein